MEDIFRKTYPVLIRNVRIGKEPQEIFLDGTGRIGEIGPDLARDRAAETEFIIDGNGALVLPGCVNTHTHAAMTLLRGYADDMVLQDWLVNRIWPLEAHLTGEDVYWGTRLACLEMIRSGTTAFNDMYFFMEEAARAVDEAGIRAVLCHGFIDLGDAGKREAECRATEKLVAHIRSLNNPRIRAAVGPHAPYTVSDEGLRWCADVAREQGIGIHIHVCETEKEVTDSIAARGKRPVAILDACGILTSRTVAAHCCWLDAAECRLFAERGVHVSHNPVSNMKLATNRAMPYPDLRAAGVNVTLGTDGCSSNNNLDMLETAKTAALLQKFSWNDPTVLPAGEALAMATSAGARALGFGDGRLEAGSPADIILVDTKSACATPMHNPVSNMVYACNGSAVETVICNGRILMLERNVPGEQEILDGAARAAAALVARAGQT